MENFVFANPTKIVFGKDAEMQAGSEVRNYSSKVLLHYGSGSIARTGLLDRLRESLSNAGIQAFELGGVCPNPRLCLVREGINLCRDQGITFILAAGGGSVIDSAKAIAVGVPYTGDVWDFYDYVSQPAEALAIGVVLTNPGSGSESSASSVITNCELELKRAVTTELIRPCFALMNPELTYTLPLFQTSCGAADVMCHVMERYFTNTRNVELTDRLCEAVLTTLIATMPVLMRDTGNYAARAEIMWAGSIAHNDLLSTGRDGDWASHAIEHEISAVYDVAHGAGLSAVFPAWMKYVYRHDIARFARFATRVWKVDPDFTNPEATALEGIRRLESFFRALGLPVRLSEMQIPGTRLEEMAVKSTVAGHGSIGNFVKLDAKAVLDILELAR